MALPEVQIMGIVNVTPDSFHDGGKYYSINKAVAQGLKLEYEGADILDIGGESTRPGAATVSTEEELQRVVPVVEELVQQSSSRISVDTTKAVVAHEALKKGAHIINDISGMTFDPQMAEVVSEYNAELVIMHTSGRPEVMQEKTHYDSVIDSIIAYFEERLTIAEKYGIDLKKIIIDPGIGFGKTLEDNYRILNNIHTFKRFSCPVLIGLSHKSLIGKVLPEGEERLSATIALNTVSLLYGADIIRVHDVREHASVLKTLKMLDSMK